jgi:D-beta-D-heptose 7-phosphate kinase/D-beta-D-heptose 1-phosphate adenosyltransferase
MPDRARLSDALDRLGGARVAVVGDVMLDRYVYGEAERISPEAPVPVLLVSDEKPMLGGAGNVVRNLSALGARSAFLSVVGDDSDAEQIKALLREVAGTEAAIVPVLDRPTSRKTRFVTGGHQLLRVDRERTGPLAHGDEDAVIARVPAMVSGAGAVILSDYGKGVLTDRVIAAVMAAANAAGIPVLVDPKGLDYGRYRGAAVITPNRTELREATAMPTGTSDAVAAAARKIIAECAIAAVLGTRGPQGMTLIERGGVHDIPAVSREVFDVSGAGDTVIATVAAGLAAGLPLLDAAQLANAAAGIVVGKVGTAVAYPDEIRAALSDLDWRAGKILDRQRATEAVARWRALGQRVGFTNGCFDLLHPGHIHLLKQARAACDRLVVGLNSDASVQRLKGNGRPVQDEAARAAVLASLADVDLVTVFAEDTPQALIAALRPDVLVKGADYSLESVVGAAFVQSYGGKVLLAQLLPGHSTTATVAKLGQ